MVINIVFVVDVLPTYVHFTSDNKDKTFYVIEENTCHP